MAKRAVRLVAVLSMTLFVIGCHAPSPNSVAFYEKSPDNALPAINFYTMKPSAGLTELCDQKDCGKSPEILEGIYTYLQRSDVFQGVATGPDARNEYSVYSVVREIATGSTAGNIANAALAGATLLLVPTTQAREYHSEFVVTWHDLKIAEYSFVTPFEYKISLYDTPAKENGLVSEKIAADFISSAQGDHVFSSERIYSILKATDYHRDLKPPLQIGDFRHEDFHLYPSPLLGVQLRYVDQKAKQIADVYVYPIRKTDWSDVQQVTGEEIDVALKDVELSVKGGAYKSAEFSKPVPISLKADDHIGKGWISTGEVTWSSGKTTTDYIYLFAAKDKYIKFRLSLDGNNLTRSQVDGFVSGFLEHVVVPDESFFMASLRQRQRDSAIK